MKCQHCEKQATFHITELTDPSGPQVVHLCEEHVRMYLRQDDGKPAASALKECWKSSSSSSKRLSNWPNKTRRLVRCAALRSPNFGKPGG